MSNELASTGGHIDIKAATLFVDRQEKLSCSTSFENHFALSLL